VAAAAHSLSQLAAAAVPVLAQPGGRTACLERQVDAGCYVLDSLVLISNNRPQLTAHTAQQLESACSLVFGPGRTVLERIVASSAAQHLPLLATELARSTIRQVHVVAAVLERVLSPEHQPQAAAAFANTAAKPAALLPWLATVSQTLPLVLADIDQGEWLAFLLVLCTVHRGTVHVG